MNIAIDFSILLHSNFYVAKLSGVVSVDRLTKMCVASIEKIGRDTQSTFNRIPSTYLCTDTGTSWRKTIHPGYKESRIPNEEFLDVAIPTRENIKEMGYTILEMDNMEADDWGFLMASFLQPCLLVSNDDDWKQMVISEDVVYFNFRKKTYATYEDINTDYEAFIKLLYGCPGDEIPRVLPKGIRKVFVEEMFGVVDSIWKPGQSYLKAVKKAFADNGVVLDTKQLIINRLIANYSVGNLEKQFNSNWHGIKQQLSIS